MCRRLRTIAICACWPPRHPDAASRNDRSAAPGGKPVDVQTDQDYCGDSAAQAVVQPARNTALAGSLAVYISTFYSFKGGVGRTMALVNAAVELAEGAQSARRGFRLGGARLSRLFPPRGGSCSPWRWNGVEKCKPALAFCGRFSIQVQMLQRASGPWRSCRLPSLPRASAKKHAICLVQTELGPKR